VGVSPRKTYDDAFQPRSGDTGVAAAPLTLDIIRKPWAYAHG